jgi:hypothetical protein
MKYTFISLIAIFFLNICLYAQEAQNVDFIFRNNSFVVKYDLVGCKNNYMYDVKLMMEGKESGFYYPINISGDLTNLVCGNGKTITWSPLAEGKQIKEDVRFIVTIIKRNKIIVDGPNNALKSVFIPGLGGLSVQKTKLPLLITTGFIFSSIQAYRYNTITNSNYANYLSASTQNDMNNFYTISKDARNKTYLYFGIAASLWATDIIYTIIRGNKNKQKQLTEKHLIGSSWKLNVYSDYYSVNIGLKKQIK